MRKEIFRFKEKNGYPPLIGYMPALYPDCDEYKNIMTLCFNSGLRFVEVGIPVENPYLDGSIISSALLELTQKKTEPEEFLKESGRIVRASGMHGLVMLYNETLEHYGTDSIMESCRKTGFETLLVPNVTPVNREILYKLSLSTGVEVVNFIGIKYSEREIEEIIQQTTGFLYLQSTDGSTGGQFTADAELKKRLLNIKKKAEPYELPVALGFGISTPDDAKLAADMGADAAIIGTAFLKAVQAGRAVFSEYLNGFRLFLEDTR